MGYRAMVKTRSDENWAGNALVFKTKEEASAHLMDLRSRLVLVIAGKVTKTIKPVNAYWDLVEGRLYMSLEKREGK